MYQPINSLPLNRKVVILLVNGQERKGIYDGKFIHLPVSLVTYDHIKVQEAKGWREIR